MQATINFVQVIAGTATLNLNLVTGDYYSTGTNTASVTDLDQYWFVRFSMTASTPSMAVRVNPSAGYAVDLINTNATANGYVIMSDFFVRDIYDSSEAPIKLVAERSAYVPAMFNVYKECVTA
jgi:hypothetical protein